MPPWIFTEPCLDEPDACLVRFPAVASVACSCEILGIVDVRDALISQVKRNTFSLCEINREDVIDFQRLSAQPFPAVSASVSAFRHRMCLKIRLSVICSALLVFCVCTHDPAVHFLTESFRSSDIVFVFTSGAVSVFADAVDLVQERIGIKSLRCIFRC